MRTIKFRGVPTPIMFEYDEDAEDLLFASTLKLAGYDGSFVYGNLIIEDDQPFIVGKIVDDENGYLEYWVPVLPETVGQRLDAPDKHGAEMYEGDIVAKEWLNAVIVFFRGAFRLIHYPVYDDPYPSSVFGIDYRKGFRESKDSRHFRQNPQDYAVIGNIHDASKMLEVK